MGEMIINNKEMLLNRDKLKSVIDKRGMDYISLHKKVEDSYGLNLSYKSFMSILSNRSTWKLIYAHAISDVLNLNIYDIFEIVEVDVEKKKIEKQRFKEKYGKK